MNLSGLNHKERLLLADILGVSVSDLYIQDFSLTEEQKLKFKQGRDKLKQGYPLDYLLSKIKFLDLDVKINEGVFIPRPETEEWVLNIIKNYQLKIRNSDLIVDLCAGSGVIGLGLARSFEDKKVLSVELFEEVVENIEHNKQLNSIENLKVYNSDLFSDKNLFSEINSFESWALFCNPPYIPSDDKKNIQKNNLAFEPQEAIFADHQGLGVFNEILNQLVLFDRKPGLCVFELDPRNIKQARSRLSRIYNETMIISDFNGFERVLIGVEGL